MRCPGAELQLVQADRAPSVLSNLEHIAYESGLKNRLQRISFGYLRLTLLLQMHIRFTIISFGVTGLLPEHF